MMNSSTRLDSSRPPIGVKPNSEERWPSWNTSTSRPGADGDRQQVHQQRQHRDHERAGHQEQEAAGDEHEDRERQRGVGGDRGLLVDEPRGGTADQQGRRRAGEGAQVVHQALVGGRADDRRAAPVRPPTCRARDSAARPRGLACAPATVCARRASAATLGPPEPLEPAGPACTTSVTVCAPLTAKSRVIVSATWRGCEEAGSTWASAGVSARRSAGEAIRAAARRCPARPRPGGA